MEAPLVGLQVVTNFCALREADVAIDNRPADARVPADIHVVVDNRFRDLRITIYADIGAQHGFHHASARNDGASGYNRIQRHAHALGVGENKFRRRILVDPGAQRPGGVIQVENGRNAYQIHVCFVVGVQRSDVAPVQRILAVFVDEVVREHAMLGDDARKNVFAEIVTRLGIFRIREQDRDHQVGIENIDAHGRAAMAGLVRRLFGYRRFFLEAHDAPVFIGFNNAELQRGLLRGNLNGGHGNIRAGIDMLLEHAAVVHFVNVIAGENENVLRTLAADGINILIHRVGGALVPLLRHSHLRRQYFDILAEARKRGPSRANVAIEAEGFVLREHEHAPQIRVDAIGKRDIDDAIESAERNRWLGTIARQRPQPFTLASRKKYSDGVAHIGHGQTPGDVFTSGVEFSSIGEAEYKWRSEGGQQRFSVSQGLIYSIIIKLLQYN